MRENITVRAAAVVCPAEKPLTSPAGREERGSKMRRFTISFGVGMLFLFGGMAKTDIPRQINFQGILKTGAGQPVADGSYSVVFKIYDAPTLGNVLWMETQSVSTAGGLFTTLLGSSTPVPESLFNDTSRYLGITVDADPEMIPRQRLSSVGYSYVSSQWTSTGENLFRLNGKVGIGTTNPLNKLFVSVGDNDGVGIERGANFVALTPRNTGQGNVPLLDLINGEPGGKRNIIMSTVHGLEFNDVSETSQFIFRTNSGVDRLHITAAGNVGIGTGSPTKKLEVAGSIKVGANDTVFFQQSFQQQSAFAPSPGWYDSNVHK